MSHRSPPLPLSSSSPSPNTMHSPHLDEVLITLSPFVGHAGQVGVPLLAVATNHPAVVELVLSQETFGVVVAINVDLSEGVVGGRFLHTFVHSCLQPGQQ